MPWEEVDELQRIIEGAAHYPLWNAAGRGGIQTVGNQNFAQVGSFGQSLQDIALWVAMREADRDRVADLVGWDADRKAGKKRRPYKVDALPERISQAFSDLLYGEDPDIVAPTALEAAKERKRLAEEQDRKEKEKKDAQAKAVQQAFLKGEPPEVIDEEDPEDPNAPEPFEDVVDPDQEAYDAMIEENDLPSELRRWAADCSSEGEIWWRIYVDPEASEWPLVEGHSRLDVVPLWRGKKLMAAAFFSDLGEEKIKLKGEVTTTIWRHVEIHAAGVVRNILYKGDYGTLGKPMPLTSRPETENLEEEWEHNLDDILCGRIPNRLGRDFRIGISDYQGIRDQLTDLNEARTIMAENARLTAKKRMVVPAEAINEDGDFDAGDDVLVAEALDVSMEGKVGPYLVLEYQFEAQALIEYIKDLVATALTRVGLMQQFVNSGEGSEGQAFSGTALRTRLIPTTLAAAGKARYFDDATPKMLRAMARVAAMPVENGGCGQSFKNLDDYPIVERSSVLPEDPAEETTRHVQGVQGEVESIQTAVEQLHPDWDENQVKEEVDRIKEDKSTTGGGGLFGPPGLPGGGDGPPHFGPPAPPGSGPDAGTEDDGTDGQG